MSELIADLSHESDHHLYKSAVDPNPFVEFQEWFDGAIAADVYQANAMTLATATAEGKPSARMVLLKGFDEGGFVFYTNYESRKGQELAQNPWAALVFWWGPLQRQVRIEGKVSRVAAAESDAYFANRPRGSRLGALASWQSQIISGRDVLERRLETLGKKYQEQEVPRPPYWGGYRLQPVTIEFWQHAEDRLHDRLQYRLQEDGSWQIDRLSP